MLELKPRLLLAAVAALSALLTGHGAQAEPLLQCSVTYAGSTHVVQATPVRDPYSVPSVDIGGRFLFKAVMVGEATRLDYIKLYAYLDARRQPVLLQQATYRAPLASGARPLALTGEQHLYGGPVERELIYSCSLSGDQP